MTKIVTLTLNPALDKSTRFNGLVAEQKIRCEKPTYDAGGGGINVSKAIKRLGGDSLAIFPIGGSSGELLLSILSKEVHSETVLSMNWTRENFIAVDASTNAQYRFGMPSEEIEITVLEQLVQKVYQADAEFLVISGSMTPEVAKYIFTSLKSFFQNSKVIIDTSGESLNLALQYPLFMIKPNIGELANLVGKPKLEENEVIEAAKSLITQNKCSIVVVSMGASGAFLITENENYFTPAPPVKKKSTVGAGDSMVGGMVYALSEGLDYKKVLNWGVACGSAATMNEGTKLFDVKDAQRLYAFLEQLK